MEYPNLANVVTSDMVSTKGTGSYKADYVNWATVMNLLHEHAPGWQPFLHIAPNGSHVYESPNGTGYMLIAFRHPEHGETMPWPQAVMDNRNAAIPMDGITARHVTDTHRRGICAAAAGLFGLAYQLWAKMPVEDPHHDDAPPVETKSAIQLICQDLVPLETWDAAEANYYVLLEADKGTSGIAKVVTKLIEGWIGLVSMSEQFDAIANAVESYHASGHIRANTREALLKRVSAAADEMETLDDVTA